MRPLRWEGFPGLLIAIFLEIYETYKPNRALRDRGTPYLYPNIQVGFYNFYN